MGSGQESLSGEERAKVEEVERERLLVLQEAELERKKKHSKLEEEREKMRQSVREKYNIKKLDVSEEEDLRRKQEVEMANNIAAMDPRNVSASAAETSNKKLIESVNQQAAAASEAADADFATKLMSGNVSGAAAQVATKVQSMLPQNFSIFKPKD